MTADAVGGVWSYALDLAAGLAAHGVRTLLAVLGPAPDAGRCEAARAVPGLTMLATGLPLDWLADSATEIAVAGEALALMARQEGVDLVHLNSPALAVAGFPVPVLGACHSCLATWWRAMRGAAPLPSDFAWRTELLGRGYAAADTLVAPSAAFAGATATAYRLARLPQVVHNGRRRPAAMAATQAPLVFTAGRLWDEGKDLGTLDRAAARLPVPVLAAGPVEGPNGARVALRHLRLAGQLSAEEVAAFLAQGPVFASAARYEPFGLAVLEAAQAGCALVLSDIPSFRELWDGTALFVPPGDDEALATAILGLLREPDHRRIFSLAARERAQRYGVEAMTEGMLKLYGKLLGGGAGMRRGKAA